MSSSLRRLRFASVLLVLVAAQSLVVAGGRGGTVSSQAAPVTFDYGVACGDATTSDVVLWTRTGTSASVVPELLDPRSGAVQQTLPPVQTSAESDYTVHAVAGGLPAGTTIAYRFRGPGGELSPTGSCRTARDEHDDSPFTFGFSGDVDWKWKPYPLVSALNREPLDYFFFLGDLIYETTNFEGTTAAETLADYRAKYRENRAPASFSREVPLRDLYATFGQYSVVDNHETGASKADPNAPPYTEGGAAVHDGSQTFVNQTPGWNDRLQAYVEYQPVRTTTITGTGDPRTDGTRQFFYSQQWGRNAELIVADDRSYRDARLRDSDQAEADSSDRTMLGKPQLQWLEEQLTASQQNGIPWKFVVVSSPIQQIGRTSEIGVDLDGVKSWEGGYRFERDTLLHYIADNDIRNVVFLTTDNHNTMINELRYHAAPGDQSSPLLPANGAIEILTGPLGASTGIAQVPEVSDLANSAQGRDVDRRVAAALSDAQRQAGLDPLGLEADNPALVSDSVVSQGGMPGLVEPSDFAAFNTFAYAVLNVSADSLSVRVTGIPAVGPNSLTTSAGMAAYTGETPAEILRFQLRAR